MKQIVKVLFFTWPLFVALAVLSSCEPQEIELPFTTIERRDKANTGQIYESKSPGLLIIAQPEDIGQLDARVTSDALTRLRDLDYKTNFAVAVFQGWKPSTGYGLQIDRLTQRGNEVIVYARFGEPKPDTETLAMITSPYELVQVSKKGTWGRNSVFRLVVNGRSVSSLSHYVP